MDLTRNIDMELDPKRDRFEDASPGRRDRAPRWLCQIGHAACVELNRAYLAQRPRLKALPKKARWNSSNLESPYVHADQDAHHGLEGRHESVRRALRRALHQADALT